MSSRTSPAAAGGVGAVGEERDVDVLLDADRVERDPAFGRRRARRVDNPDVVARQQDEQGAGLACGYAVGTGS